MKSLHKATRPRTTPARIVVESKARIGVTYQLERVKCGKPRCGRCRARAAHGPYWYAYVWTGKGVRSRYVGKAFRVLTPQERAELGTGVALSTPKQHPKKKRR